MKYIIYKNADGQMSFVVPTGALPLSEVCKKDVPYMTPYIVVDEADIPAGAPRTSWDVDLSSPHGTGLGAQRWFIQQAQAELGAIAAREPQPGDAADIARCNALIAQMQRELGQ